ncbi:hypothetical protein V6N12_007941 [Hibiscus sabdariffa]|uniref:Uncharacterized protein n=1 Tax=Hibiscus sabdariffa TaxID=183260 RepID=A0ABR1ZHW0_9ROSI
MLTHQPVCEPSLNHSNGGAIQTVDRKGILLLCECEPTGRDLDGVSPTRTTISYNYMLCSNMESRSSTGLLNTTEFM